MKWGEACVGSCVDISVGRFQKILHNIHVTDATCNMKWGDADGG
eukprot:CAMPEP_0198111912 /NCGR_PEP_ID=MMETSP1442-20131203/3839_1 /TAXON_ID= /ORGANISM="Craspedostauros australis, Strain CCMP3328" /LENGTH=43 /DNA_ID= /DNA_START= /DNA_END= /DNA_ORIENTATION=